MDFNIYKIGAFIVLVLVYLAVRKLFKKFANFTEKIGNSAHNEEEIKRLETKIITLEQKLNNKL